VIDWNALAHEYYGEKQHPDAPSLKVKDLPIALELANHMKFGQGDGHAGFAEAEMLWKEVQPILDQGVSPQALHELIDTAAQHSFALHGRPPSMPELTRFADPKTHPADIAKWYHELPDRHYPVAAGDMLQAMWKAEPHALEHLGRKPVKKEGAMFAAGVDPAAHYPQAAQPMRTKPQEGQGGVPGNG
jgi:hypothetical protein